MCDFIDLIINRQNEEDYNQPSPRRAMLIDRLAYTLCQTEYYYWACVHCGDIEKLEEIVRDHEDEPRSLESFEVSRVFRGIREWIDEEFYNRSSQNPLLSEDQAFAANAAKSRDRHRCLLTNFVVANDPAHIVPPSLLNIKIYPHVGWYFWTTLETFWPKKQIERWKSILLDEYGDPGRVTSENLITLSPQAHTLWKEGRFALKPIYQSPSKDIIIVEFYWQTLQPVESSLIELRTPPVVGQQAVGHLVTAEGRSIESGQRFVFRTDDPVSMPLSRFELLQLRWFMNRVVGMTGVWLEEVEESNHGHFRSGGSTLADEDEEEDISDEDMYSGGYSSYGESYQGEDGEEDGEEEEEREDGDCDSVISNYGSDA